MATNCSPPCAENVAQELPDNQMPLFIPAGGGGGPSTVFVEDTDSIDLEGDGAIATPITATIILDPNPANLLSVSPAGVLAIGDGTGISTVSHVDTDTIDMEGAGTVGSPLSASVIVDPALGNQLTASATGLLVSLPASGTVGVDVDDTATVTLAGDGTTGSPITANAVVSTTPDNILTVDGAGLYVPPPPTPPDPGIEEVTTADTSSIDFSGLGTLADPLEATVIVDPAAGNALVSGVAGLFVATVNPGLSAVSADDTTTTTVGGDGTPGTPLTVDVKVSATAGNQITVDGTGLYVPTGGGGGITEVAVDDTTSVVLAGDGTPGDPITATVQISATAGNAATIDGTGIFVPTVTPGIADVTTADTQSIDITGDGTPGNPLEADVLISAAAGNQVTIQSDGLSVSPLVTIVTDANVNRDIIPADGQNKYIRMTNAGAKTITTRLNAVQAVPIGSVVSFVNAGGSTLTVTAEGGVTINSPASQTLVLNQYAAATLTKVGTDEWDLAGGMEAV